MNLPSYKKEILVLADTFPAAIREVVPPIKQWSEDLREKDYYVDITWREIKEGLDASKKIVHVFKADGVYIRSVNSEVVKGKWAILEASNKMLIHRLDFEQKTMNRELFNLQYLGQGFFILQKDGTEEIMAMGMEITPIGNMSWEQYVFVLANLHQSNREFILLAIAVLILLGMIIVYFGY